MWRCCVLATREPADHDAVVVARALDEVMAGDVVRNDLDGAVVFLTPPVREHVGGRSDDVRTAHHVQLQPEVALADNASQLPVVRGLLRREPDVVVVVEGDGDAARAQVVDQPHHDLVVLAVQVNDIAIEERPIVETLAWLVAEHGRFAPAASAERVGRPDGAVARVVHLFRVDDADFHVNAPPSSIGGRS
jgi:hypothetical protein